MKNKLFYGDNYEVLQQHIKDESIDLCYIDPPFNSKRNYNQIYNSIGTEDKAQAQAFVDTWEWNQRAEIDLAEIYNNYNKFTPQTVDLIQGFEKVLKKGSLLAYLVSMTLRVNEIWKVLKPTGSFYLHCDHLAGHYLKLLCDSVFCVRGGDFLNEISWKRTNNPKGSQFKSKKYGVYTDCILFYSKSYNYTFELNKAKEKLSEEEFRKKYPKEDMKGSYYDGPILRSKSMGTRPNLVYEYKGFTPSIYGWRLSKEKLIELDKEGDLGWNGKNKPFRKLRPENDQGHPIGDCWTDINRLYESKEYLGYPTQKPLSLLERIILASSNEGDTVLDAYCGCGTTVHASQKLNRKWIGIDITYQSVSLILKRLSDSFGQEVINQDNLVLHGIPRDMESARALANKQDDRVRKEFEKWIVLTYSNNRAMINDKKGGDGGIDGIARFPKVNSKDLGTVIFSVKSDKTINPSYVRDLAGTVLKEKADMGILLCLNEPSKGVRQVANEYGLWTNEYNNKQYPKIQIITVYEIVEGEIRLDSALAGIVLKQASVDDYKSKQSKLEFDLEE